MANYIDTLKNGFYNFAIRRSGVEFSSSNLILMAHDVFHSFVYARNAVHQYSFRLEIPCALVLDLGFRFANTSRSNPAVWHDGNDRRMAVKWTAT